MLIRPITGQSIVDLLGSHSESDEFVVSYLRVLTSTPDDRLAELWDKVDRKEHPVLANERLCAILRGIDQVIDLYIYLKRDAGIYLEIEDGDLIDNKL